MGHKWAFSDPVNFTIQVTDECCEFETGITTTQGNKKPTCASYIFCDIGIDFCIPKNLDWSDSHDKTDTNLRQRK